MMTSIFVLVGILLGITISICCYRLIIGPGTFNRIAATNAIGTKAMVLVIIVGYIMERPHFIDIAFMYAILNFIGVILVSKYLEGGRICS